jgi:hypothetical protein
MKNKGSFADGVAGNAGRKTMSRLENTPAG